MTYRISARTKPTKTNPRGLVEVQTISADVFETDGGVREVGKENDYARHSGFCFYAVDESMWGDTRRLVAFFPGTEWVVEEV